MGGHEISAQIVDELSVSAIRKRLQKRGQDATGKRAVVAARLKQILMQEAAVAPLAQRGAPPLAPEVLEVLRPLLKPAAAAAVEYKFTRAVGEEGKKELQFNKPCGISVDVKRGRLRLVDRLNHRAHVLDLQCRHLSFIGGVKGKGKGQFNKPTFVVADPDDSDILYISDTDNHQVVKVRESTGEVLLTFGSKGSGKGQLKFPRGLALFKKRLHVCDYFNARIQVFEAEDGKHVGSHGNGEGSGANQFAGPIGIAIAEDGTMYVSDNYNGRIQVLNSDGDFTKTFCEKGSGNGQLHCPYGVALAGDLLLIADNSNHRVVALDRKDGRQLATIGSEGEGEGQFIHPRGIAAFGSTLVVSSDHKLSFFERPPAAGVDDLLQDLAGLERACRSQGSPVLHEALLHQFRLSGKRRQSALCSQIKDEEELQAELKGKIAAAKQRAGECKAEHAQIDSKIESLEQSLVEKCGESPLGAWPAQDVALWVRTVEGGIFHEHAPEFSKRGIKGATLTSMKKEMFEFLVYSNKEHQAALWALLLELRRRSEPHARKRRRFNARGAISASASASSSSSNSSSSSSSSSSSATQVKVEPSEPEW